MQTDATILDCARLVRAGYAEMPGLKLTERQIQRLWCLDAALCDAVIASLMAGRFLRQMRGDAYVRPFRIAKGPGRTACGIFRGDVAGPALSQPVSEQGLMGFVEPRSV